MSDARRSYVYPGHPIVIGVEIMKRYPSLAAANDERGRQFPAALESALIPGAGGNVYSALECLLVGLHIGADAAVKYAAEVWDHCDDQKQRRPHVWQAGVEEAAAEEAMFRLLLSGWCEIDEPQRGGA